MAIWLRFKQRLLSRRLAALESDMKGHAFEMVGMVTISWAFLEMSLDTANAIILAHCGGDAIQTDLPASLNPKIKFIRKAYRSLPTLADFQQEGLAIADGVAALKEQRHDMVHGYTYEHLPLAAREIARLRYVGPRLEVERRTYTVADMQALNTDILGLAKRQAALASALVAHLGIEDSPDDILR